MPCFSTAWAAQSMYSASAQARQHTGNSWSQGSTVDHAACSSCAPMILLRSCRLLGWNSSASDMNQETQSLHVEKFLRQLLPTKVLQTRRACLCCLAFHGSRPKVAGPVRINLGLAVSCLVLRRALPGVILPACCAPSIMLLPILPFEHKRVLSTKKAVQSVHSITYFKHTVAAHKGAAVAVPQHSQQLLYSCSQSCFNKR